MECTEIESGYIPEFSRQKERAFSKYLLLRVSAVDFGVCKLNIAVEDPVTIC